MEVRFRDAVKRDRDGGEIQPAQQSATWIKITGGP
jgi:hypothetical protein